MENILSAIYYDPRHPASFASVQKLYDYAKLENEEITLNDVKNWLSKQNVYTLHRPARKNFLRNKIIVSYIDEQWECDLVDMRYYSRQNRGFNYILNIIDCFSKYLFSIPIKTKKSTEIIKEFKKIFKDRKPIKLRSDKGGEFDNILFRKFCDQNNVRYFTTQNSSIKCAIVERVNRTLKNRIFRYMTHKGTKKYFDVLPQILSAYNNSVHRTTKMPPSEISIEDEPIVFQTMYNVPNLITKNSLKVKPKLKVNDTVRQKYEISSLEKSYYPLWTDMVYKINKIYKKLNRPQYGIEIEGEKLKRRFYPEELQKVNVDEDSDFLIEKIIKYRYRDKHREALVKWRGYPAKYNQWIRMDQIKDL